MESLAVGKEKEKIKGVLGHVASATYNADNQLASSTNADGNKILDTYDNAGQLTAKSYIAANGAQTDAESFTYDKDGMETAASNSYGGYAFTLDPAERVTRQTDPFGLTLNYTNDPNGKVTQVSDSAGGTLNSVYDADNRLTNRNFSETGTSLRIELTYNAQSQITDEKRYNAATGGTLVGETTQSFDPVGNVTEIKHKTGSGTVLEDFTYNYDPANRLTSETDTINGGTPTTTNYGYDGANQLTSAGSSNYNYDLTGNRNTGANQVGPDNQLVADANWTYKYDPAGKEIEKDGIAGGQYAGIVWKYGYDGANRLVSATASNNSGTIVTVTESYDVFGNRVEKDVTQSGTTTVTRFAYDMSGREGGLAGPWADLNSTNQVTTRRLYLDAVDAVFARIGGTGTIDWYLGDHLGSIRGLMNNSGTLDDTLTWDAYGNLVSESTPANGDRYAYTGRERDVETGLQYNRARWYDPATGRWISQDPLGFDAGDSNLYRYVNNRPTIVVDPSGKQAVTTEPQLGEVKFADGLLSFHVRMKLNKQGVANTLIFTPNNPADKHVMFVQITKPRLGKDPTWPKDKDGNSLSNFYKELVDPNSGFALDASPNETDPYYNARWDGVKWVAAKDLAGNKLEIGDGSTKTPAVMTDTPQAAASDVRAGKGDVVYEFQTLIVSLERKKVLGLIKWGFRIKDQKGSPVEMFEVKTEKEPSMEFTGVIQQLKKVQGKKVTIGKYSVTIRNLEHWGPDGDALPLK